MSRCESRNPLDPNMQCAASEGHTWEHRLGGISWTDETEVRPLLHKEVARERAFRVEAEQQRDEFFSALGVLSDRCEQLEQALETLATGEDLVDEEDYQAFARAALAAPPSPEQEQQ